MGLSSAMAAALSGLRASQAGLDVVADNVSNAGSPYYTRKSVPNEQMVLAGETNGVRTGAVVRSLDALLQRQMQAEAAGGGYTSTKVDYHDRLDQLFGSPGKPGALDTVVNNFTNSLQGLVSSPDSYSARMTVVNNAQMAVQQLNGMSDDIQLLRTEAESAIATGVDTINDALRTIEQLDGQIVSQSENGAPPAALLDERDKYVSILSSLIDIRVVPRELNRIAIFTTSGTMLFDKQRANLTFDAHGALGANSLYDRDPTKRGVGTVAITSPNGLTIDMIGDRQIRSGELGALIELRDDTLVKAQQQVDTLAASLATALSNRTVDGTVNASSGDTGFDLDITGLQNGNPITLSYSVGGQGRRAIFVQVDPSTSLPLVQPYGGPAGIEVIGFSGGSAGATAAIQAKLGAGFTVSATGNNLTILDDGVAATTDITAASASITTMTTTGSGVELPLFIDVGNNAPYTGAFDDPMQIRGFAGRIGVNPAVLADNSLLVKPTPTSPEGDPARPRLMLEALTNTQRIFPSDTGIGGTLNLFNGSVTSFAREVVNTQGRDAATAQNLDDGQQVVVRALQDRFKQTSGVNIDTEMATLVQLQNAYAANARVMSTVKDMIDLLLNM